uniref:Reverse transcriptase domain-containing protein n=1 Tax=Tanacetum cinerariifolium TaxID=118510 RepID=A0A699HFY6_TANCI|nr:reverse transcriptase domain-containing protein [Tanacetum cinerariifolium]
MTEHLHHWGNGTTTRESINDSSDNVDSKKLKENIYVIQTVYITQPDDVALATSPILDKHLNMFGEEFRYYHGCLKVKEYESIFGATARECMRTRSSSNLPVESSPNPTTSNPKRRNCRRSKQPFILEESPVDMMASQRIMAELLRASTKGYAEVIVVPSILAEQFELKYRAARRWLEKEPSRSILTWEDLFSKFINEFFPPSRTTNVRNEISNFQQRFDESFHEAWDRYKDLLRACPHHGFTKLHQLDTFYNALNPADQDSLNSTAGGNLLERRTQDVLTIIENKSKQTSAVTTSMTAILKQFQATPPPTSVKSVEEICVTCGGAHTYYRCLTASGNTFSELQDNIQ